MTATYVTVEFWNLSFFLYYLCWRIPYTYCFKFCAF